MKKFLLLNFLVFCFATSIFSQEKENIRVGVFLDMSGVTSNFGVSTNNGIRLAVEEINAKGGINGRKLEIFLENSQGIPEKARVAVKNLIEEKKVHAILGEIASSNTLAAAPVAQEAKIPMISLWASSPKVTQVGDFIFRLCFVDPVNGEAMAKFAFNKLKIKKAAIFGDENSDYSKNSARTFKETFIDIGGKIVVSESYSQFDQDFKAKLVKIRQLKADLIYLPGYYGEVGVIAKQARELKMKMPLLGADGWDSPELWKLGGNALNNSYISNHFANDNPAFAIQKFNKSYWNMFYFKPDSLAALGYDAVYLLTDALRRAKTTDGVNLRDAIAQTTDFDGVTGKITKFNLVRNPIKSAVIQKLDTTTNSFKYYSTIEP